MASAVCAGVQRCSVTRCTTSSLPSGVSFALEWDMRASSSRLVSRNPNPNREALPLSTMSVGCLLYTSDAADDLLCVDLGGRRIIKKKKTIQNRYISRY